MPNMKWDWMYNFIHLGWPRLGIARLTAADFFCYINVRVLRPQ